MQGIGGNCSVLRAAKTSKQTTALTQKVEIGFFRCLVALQQVGLAVPPLRWMLVGRRRGRPCGPWSPSYHNPGSIGSCVMTEQQAVVFIIDDDASVRDGVTDLLSSVGVRVESFGSVQEFLQSKRADAPGCIVLDVRLPGTSGLEFQRTLTESNIQLPIIFISGYGDISMSVRAIKSGAMEFLTKPLRDQELLDAVQTAIERDRARRQQVRLVAELQERFMSLTARERDVLPLVVAGRQNKQIAHELNLSEMTVKVHRSQVMRKMRARSLVDLVRMADRLGVSTRKS
jgi:FixJ family two-component response regulator